MINNNNNNDFEHGLTEHADNEDQHNTNWQDDKGEVEHIVNSRHIRLAD